jgi:hypothetical protein
MNAIPDKGILPPRAVLGEGLSHGAIEGTGGGPSRTNTEAGYQAISEQVDL